MVKPNILENHATCDNHVIEPFSRDLTIFLWAIERLLSFFAFSLDVADEERKRSPHGFPTFYGDKSVRLRLQ